MVLLSNGEFLVHVPLRPQNKAEAPHRQRTDDIVAWSNRIGSLRDQNPKKKEEKRVRALSATRMGRFSLAENGDRPGLNQWTTWSPRESRPNLPIKNETKKTTLTTIYELPACSEYTSSRCECRTQPTTIFPSFFLSFFLSFFPEWTIFSASACKTVAARPMAVDSTLLSLSGFLN